MSPARRSARRKGWPRGLYESRPGYLIWKHPTTREVYVLGRVPIAHAINEALMANKKVADESLPSLVAMIDGTAGHTMGDLIDKMPAPPKASSAKTFRSLDKRIREAMGSRLCADLTTAHCAAMIEAVLDEGKAHHARAIRGRLRALCKFAQQLGWMKENPVEVTRKPEAEVARARLSLAQFLAIRERATEFLPRAMNLALVTGQDRSTVAAMRKADVKDGRLICQRSKTERKNAPIAIPVALRLDALGLSLDDILKERTGIMSPYLVHHTVAYPGTPAGSAVHVDAISSAFTEARKAAGIPDVLEDGKLAPTFHEIRSLAKRLYDAQGNVDTKILLGHATEQMAELYKKTRDMVPVEVKIGRA